ncbi:MAG: DUF1232 domain-containing protein [Timaviella obliquedivisa GSE-PSE-MK23-08B]|jgi:uncharacterized membrane protein YkvA (DUF1232 family)|nr:DUF1232 domain-containing protein [Timaviella obliquedivisa GSE-PSE-MK23-08B]
MANNSGEFSEQNFWQKIRDFATYAGREVVEKALVLFFTAQRPETPLWAKTVIYSALAYFILPTDAIPDFIPLSGYADDLGTLVMALGTVTMSITPEVKASAKQTVDSWFGAQQSSDPSGIWEAARSTPQENDPIRVIDIE